MILTSQADAYSFTITPSPPAAITTATQILDAYGDVGTVEEGGVIDVTSDYGIEATADGVTVNNAGSVTGGSISGIKILNNSTVNNSGNGTAEGGYVGIHAEGNSNTITNLGTAAGNVGIGADGNNNMLSNSGMTRGASDGFGIVAFGNSNTITNSGMADGNVGMFAQGTFNTFINSGTVTGSIVAYGAGSTITNSGTTTGDYGIYADSTIYGDGTGFTIANSGTATGSSDGFGIIAFGDGGKINNSGTATGGNGIYSEGIGNSITNSGNIVGELAAVFFEGSGNTLTLLAGSKVQGLLDIAGNGGNTLVIGRRLNTALRFTGVPEATIETNGMPSVAFGGVLAVVDPTVYAAEDDMLGDLSRSLADVVDGRLGFATGHRANNIVISTSNAEPSGSQWKTWATGIGNYRSQTTDDIYDGFDTTLGGFALGTDGVLSSGTKFGGFVGASRAHLRTNAGAEQADSNSAYAGLYAGYSLPKAFVNLAVMGGHTNASTSRDVLNNMVAGGIEQAKGNPDGVFFAPQVTIGTDIQSHGSMITPSLRVAYTKLSMDSYDETGSAADLSVGSRTVSLVDLRGQLAFAIKPILTSSGQFDATMRLGADATFTHSDDITATLLGQPITFSTSSQETTLRGFAGVDLIHAMDNGADLKLSVEAGYDTNHAATLKGTAGLAWAF
jgi:hypothetical protein